MNLKTFNFNGGHHPDSGHKTTGGFVRKDRNTALPLTSFDSEHLQVVLENPIFIAKRTLDDLRPQSSMAYSCNLMPIVGACHTACCMLCTPYIKINIAIYHSENCEQVCTNCLC